MYFKKRKYALESIRNNKAPGFDNIDGRIVKKLSKKFQNFTFDITKYMPII